MPTRLDHLVIAATSLEQGVEYVQHELGVVVPKGGEHPLMATHNHLMNIGGEVFLEIVAINPDATPPNRPRWFSLDDPAVQHSLMNEPRLLTWVVNTDDLLRSRANASFDIGAPTPLARGHLNWLFAIPDDGALLAGGLLPHCMQWQTDKHPALSMPDLGCRLDELTIHHPYSDWTSERLKQLGADNIVSVAPLPANHLPFLSASIETPTGRVLLDSKLAQP